MQKKIKIFYSNPYNSDKLSESFFYPLLQKNVHVAETKKEKEADLKIAHIHQDTPKNNYPKKSIFLCGENLYYSINLFKIMEKLFKRIRLSTEIIHFILPRSILNIPLFFARKRYLNFLKNIARVDNSNIFAILTNNLRARNMISLPFFLQVNQIRRKMDLLKNKKLPKIEKDRFCCFIVSNESSFERIDFFKQLSKYKKVDCFGGTSFTNADNSEIPSGCFDNFSFFSRYKFVICFENSFNEDYVTEKLPNVMLGGAIPIYRGASNVGEYFNTESFINFDDYGSYDQMINKIIELDKDSRKYWNFLNRPWMIKRNKKRVAEKQKELVCFLKKVLSL